MESTRKKALEIMQKGLVSYQLLSKGWDVSDHFGDGCDLIAEKAGRFIKIELKAIVFSLDPTNQKKRQGEGAQEQGLFPTHCVTSLYNLRNSNGFEEQTGTKDRLIFLQRLGMKNCGFSLDGF